MTSAPARAFRTRWPRRDRHQCQSRGTGCAAVQGPGIRQPCASRPAAMDVADPGPGPADHVVPQRQHAMQQDRHERNQDPRGDPKRACKARGNGRDDDCCRISSQRLHLRSEEHTSELQSRPHLVCRLLLEKKKKKKRTNLTIKKKKKKK